MELYKYTQSHGINILMNYEIVVTPPNQFNDPFEFFPVVDNRFVEEDCIIRFENSHFIEKLRNFLIDRGTYTGSKEKFQIYLKNNKKEVIDKMKNASVITSQKVGPDLPDFASEIRGLFCTSKIVNHPLLWAHYGEGHKGIVIEFDMQEKYFPNNVPIPVRYSEKRVVVNFSFYLDENKFDEQIKKLSSTKSKVWSYEVEYRQIFDLAQCNKKRCDNDNVERYFVKIDPSCIKRVIIGLRSTKEFEKKVKKELNKKDLYHVILEKAFPDNNSFGICSSRI